MAGDQGSAAAHEIAFPAERLDSAGGLGNTTYRIRAGEGKSEEGRGEHLDGGVEGGCPLHTRTADGQTSGATVDWGPILEPVPLYFVCPKIKRRCYLAGL